jgi:hypothetical protein
MQRRYLGLALVALLCVVCSTAPARAQMAEVVSSCGVITLPVGQVYRLYTDHNGNLCVSGAGGAGGSGGAATVADGADVTQGATADAAAAAGGAGTVSAKLREVTALLNSINSGIAASIAAGTNVIGGVTASLGVSNGWTPLRLSALSTTAIAIKQTPGELGMLSCWNPNATVVYIQVFNLAVASVTLGTTVPTMSIPIAPTSTGGFALSNPGVTFSGAIAVAATTGPANASAASTPPDCNAAFN